VKKQNTRAKITEASPLALDLLFKFLNLS